MNISREAMAAAAYTERPMMSRMSMLRSGSVVERTYMPVAVEVTLMVEGRDAFKLY
jgi:hypothetical protein